MSPYESPTQAAASFSDRDTSGAAAMAGLTPAVIAGVAALLLVRMISSSLHMVVLAFEQQALGGWLSRLLGGYMALSVMAAVMLVAVVATSNLGPPSGPRRIVALAAAVILSSAIGLLLRIAVADQFKLANGWERLYFYATFAWPRYIILGGLLTAAGEVYRREKASLRAMRQAEADRASLERQMVEARLRALQAQIEPHFLFNTLANVRRLYERDTAAGRVMLESLMLYLETALPQLRNAASTLSREASLVESFLRIHEIRMGRRLAFRVDIPPSLGAIPVPPAMLLTLVENSIKHGLNPSPRGGRIDVAARTDNGRLLLSVEDTGVGFIPGSAGGTGLANVRARLSAQFGGRAQLVLENNTRGGATAILELPLADVSTAR